MTPEELQEIERLDRLSTKGPFRINRYDCDGGAINWQVQQDHDSHGCEVIANITDDEPKRARYDAAFFVLARTLLPRLARDLAAERARTAEIEAELADLKASSDPLRDLAAARETTRRIADRCLDLGRELEALRAAVRAHRAAHEAGEGETVALVRLYQLAKLA